MPQPPLSRVGDLDIDEQFDVQEASWRLQRIGWVAMGLLLLAGLAGVFGHGPLSQVRLGDPAGLELVFGRFERRTKESVLRVRLGPPADGRVRLWIDASYLSGQPLVRVQPEPEGMELVDGRLLLDLRVAGDRPEVRIDTRPEVFGPVRGRLGIVDGPELSFRQFVYP